MAENLVPRAAVGRLLKKTTELRASPEAREELTFALEEIGGEVARKAHELAKFAGRKTVTAKDIHLATH